MTSFASNAGEEKKRNHEQKVSLVMKLLNNKGKGAANEIRQRIASGEAPKAKGQCFDIEVLKSALQQWEEAQAAQGERRLPMPPKSWSSATADDVDMKRADEAPVSPSKLKRRPSATPNSAQELGAARTPKNTKTAPAFGSGSGSSASAKNRELRNFLDASRRRSLHGDHSAGRTPQKISEVGGLMRTASEISAARRGRGASDVSIPPSSNVRRSIATPCRSKPQDFTEISPPSHQHVQSRLSTPSARKYRGLESPAQAAAARVPEAPTKDFSPTAKRRVQDQTPDSDESPPCKRRVTDDFYRMKVDQQASLERPWANLGGEPHPEPSPASEAQLPVAGSVKDLKALLTENNLDFTGFVEKHEFQALWQKFTELRKRPLEELQAACFAKGGQKFIDAISCARYLASEASEKGGCQQQQQKQQQQPQQQQQQQQQQKQVPSPTATCNNMGPGGLQRDREAQEEVRRIIPLRKEAFRCSADWGFAVLGAASRDAAGVQRGYRSLMRKLHPDKVSQSERVEKTIELIREAKDVCERSLSRTELPQMPKDLRCEILDATPGRRRIELRWTAAEKRPNAPVCRYMIGALDPAYGKPLTITVLEPDYNQELRRFVSVEELTRFVLAEEELKKMPTLWNQKYAMVQVCAANEAGQSGWAKLEVPLVAGLKNQPARWGPRMSTGSGSTASPSGSRSPSDSSWDESGSEASSPNSPDREPAFARHRVQGNGSDPRMFEMELRRLNGPDMKIWLRGQYKTRMASWLKTLRMPVTGSKEELIERVLDVMGVR
eukprot:TRINITY_DN2557_c3_g1_i1.p1 TRINITY_DN2557_c3_g1~~TRINITY_DN2557_c3_g1_i1.p1  ORF type:complete len:802 (+),score=176.02 TRINITY_DN2557_c3_g1_i1:64-2406(+)